MALSIQVKPSEEAQVLLLTKVVSEPNTMSISLRKPFLTGEKKNQTKPVLKMPSAPDPSPVGRALQQQSPQHVPAEGAPFVPTAHTGATSTKSLTPIPRSGFDTQIQSTSISR